MRKQQEVNKAKSQQAAQPFVPKCFEKPCKEMRDAPAPSKVVELEDNEQLDRSRRILEAKSKFYDRMTASGGSVNTDETCLVMFNAKKQNDKPESYPSSSSDEDEVPGDIPAGDEGDWVEYTDSLGRTRRCLRTDLEFFKKRDESLIDTPALKTEDKPSSAPLSSESESESEDELLKTGRLIQQTREQWEKQEEENKDKEYIHYQDILFDGKLTPFLYFEKNHCPLINSYQFNYPSEARTHGVGYYQFSTDSEERLKQQKELEIRRLATLEAQKSRDEQRTVRERIIAERVLAAKNRQRARLGLPPLEGAPLEDPSKQGGLNQEEDEKATDKERREEEESMKEEERKSHLRPWDVGKEGTSHMTLAEDKEWTYKGHREPMSQEQWNEKMRGERNSEFAPTANLNEAKGKNTPRKRYNNVAPPVDLPVKLDDPEEFAVEEEEEQRGLFFTTKKTLKRKNYEPDEAPVAASSSSRGAGGVEVPPPPTFDYYGPPIIGLAKAPKVAPNLQTSIEAGLRFLRNQTDKTQSTSGSLWGANANYGKE